MKKLYAQYITGFLSLVITSCSASVPCDRECLKSMADLYLEAMVAHDASKAPFTENVIFTENTVRLPLTEGLWFTSSGLGDFKIYICDLQQGQVAWVGSIKEHEKQVILSLRLKVVNQRITEAETIVIRDVDEKNLENFRITAPAFSEILDPSERTPREKMLQIPELYFDALKILNDRDVPFDDNCYRLENGILTAGSFPGAPPPDSNMPRSPKCANGDIPPVLKTIHNVHPRRISVIDEEKGVTWGIYCFNHRGLASVRMPDGSIQPTYFQTPNTMPMSEMFKIKNGRILDIRLG